MGTNAPRCGLGARVMKLGRLVTRMSGFSCCLWAGLGCASGRGSAVRPPTDEAPALTEAPSARNDSARDPTVVLGADVDRQIKLLERIVAGGEGSEQPQVHLALAEAYLSRASQAAMLLFELDGQRFNAAKDQRSDVDRRYALIADQQREWLAKAIASFEALLAESGQASRKLRPAARWGLADALRRDGQSQERIQVLAALASDDPQHPFASLALIQLADQAFADTELEEARVLYERAKKSAAPGERLYADYKLGWIALNLEEVVVALEHWARVVQQGRANPIHRALVDAAAKDCVLAFARVGRPSQARAFFTRLHPELASALLMRLAESYRAEGRVADALVVLGAVASPEDRAGPR